MTRNTETHTEQPRIIAVMQSWLECEKIPANMYELLGRRLFDPDRSKILADIRSAARFLVEQQNNPNPDQAKRALMIQGELGRAESFFCDEKRQKQYDRGLLNHVQAAYEALGPERIAWSTEQLKSWLEQRQNVHSSQLSSAAESIVRDTETCTFQVSETQQGVQQPQDDAPAPAKSIGDERRKAFGNRGRSKQKFREPRTGIRHFSSATDAEGVPVAHPVAKGIAPNNPQVASLGYPLGKKNKAATADHLHHRTLRGKTWMRAGVSVFGAFVIIVIASFMLLPPSSERSLAPGSLPGADDLPQIDLVPQNPSVIPVDDRLDDNGRTPGSEVTWVGRLESIRGKRNSSDLTTGEIHFRVAASSALQFDQFEAFSEDLTIGRQLADYVTAEEERWKSAGDAKSGDRIRVEGTIVEPDEATMRMVTRADVPLVRLKSIERVDEPTSRVVAGGHTRGEESFRKPAEELGLVQLVRLPPEPDEGLRFQGIYRKYMSSDETIVLGPPGTEPTDQGVEVYLPGFDFSQFPSGAQFRVIGKGTTLSRTVVVDKMLIQRPIIMGGSIETLNSPFDNSVNTPRNAAQRKRGDVLFVVSESGHTAVLFEESWKSLDLGIAKVNWVLTDREDRVWMTGRYVNGGGAVAMLDGKQVNRYMADDGLPDKPLGHIWQDSRDRLVTSSWGAGAYVLEGEVWRMLPDQGLTNTNGCVETVSQQLWIAGHGGVVALASDLSAQGGVSWLPRGNVMAVEVGNDGTVCLGYVGGLVIVRPDGAWKLVTVDSGLPQKTPQAVLIDSQKRIWVGTWGGGAAQVDASTFEILPETSLVEAGRVRRIAEDSAGTIWVASINGLWQLPHGKSAWTRQSTPPNISQVAVVAAIPKSIAQQLLSSSGVGAMQVAGDTGAPPPDKNPHTGEQVELRQPPRTRLRFAQLRTKTGSVVQFSMGDSRAKIRQMVGTPPVAQDIEFTSGTRKAEGYLTLGRSQQAVITLFVFNPNDRVEYIAWKKIAANGSITTSQFTEAWSEVYGEYLNEAE